MKTFKFNAQEIKFAEDTSTEGEVPSRVQLLRTGLFSYYETDDMDIRQEHMMSFLYNYESKVRGVELAIDYSHNAHLEAAGWIKKLSLSEDRNELWADVEWTEKASNAIKNKEYRYLSSEFSFNYQDQEGGRQYGPCLYGAGLTNRPFVKNMKPLSLSEHKEREMDVKDLEKKLEEQATLIKSLSEKLDEDKKEKEEKEKKIVELEQEKEKAKVFSEKTNSFNKMLAEGKVVEAQRQAFIENNMVKFAELTGKVKLHNIGGEGAKAESEEELSAEQAEDKILELANAKFSEGKKELHVCVSEVLKANKKLAEKYQSKFKF